MTTVGFLGLGAMGAGMARRLIDAGHEVLVWNRSRAPLEPLVAAGARPVATPAEALRAGVAVSMLANDAAANAVFSDETLRSAAGSVHVNMSTLSLDTVRDLVARHREAGVDYVAAPVLGRPHLAASGGLNIVAAGPEAALDRAEEFLTVLGKRTWRLGDQPERANLVKIGVNYNLIHTLQALAESVNLIERGGVDGSVFVEILTDAAYTGSAYTGYGKMIAERGYLPVGFSAELGLKDLNLARSAAQEFRAALPTASVLTDIFEQTLKDEELARLDWSAMAEITRRQD
ncbi:NAD(P)-dependent oxidoreductase [Microbacterium sp. LWH12-1.2]|uniref:NAD(P)-dependent oxidoreductase n=1 Tax=Microbacterium sp. LWH12-1.2 TaxID=3135259 RepID=UPI003426E7EB